MSFTVKVSINACGEELWPDNNKFVFIMASIKNKLKTQCDKILFWLNSAGSSFEDWKGNDKISTVDLILYLYSPNAAKIQRKKSAHSQHILLHDEYFI